MKDSIEEVKQLLEDYNEIYELSDDDEVDFTMDELETVLIGSTIENIQQIPLSIERLSLTAELIRMLCIVYTHDCNQFDGSSGSTSLH